MGVTVRRVQLDAIVDLRHGVLREGLPRDAAIFDGDADPTSRHYGAFVDDRLVGCATLHLNSYEGGPAWQLRGMAVAPEFRRQNIGRAMLDYIDMETGSDLSVRLFWCNARVPATPFYQNLGWEIVSERFEIPTAGPHVRMVRPAKAAQS
jgi:predicted GNAT family N-acyltransferase